jgi:hypothetical protein
MIATNGTAMDAAKATIHVRNVDLERTPKKKRMRKKMNQQKKNNSQPII